MRWASHSGTGRKPSHTALAWGFWAFWPLCLPLPRTPQQDTSTSLSLSPGCVHLGLPSTGPCGRPARLTPSSGLDVRTSLSDLQLQGPPSHHPHHVWSGLHFWWPGPPELCLLASGQGLLQLSGTSKRAGVEATAPRLDTRAAPTTRKSVRTWRELEKPCFVCWGRGASPRGGTRAELVYPRCPLQEPRALHTTALCPVC